MHKCSSYAPLTNKYHAKLPFSLIQIGYTATVCTAI